MTIKMRMILKGYLLIWSHGTNLYYTGLYTTTHTQHPHLYSKPKPKPMIKVGSSMVVLWPPPTSLVREHVLASVVFAS